MLVGSRSSLSRPTPIPTPVFFTKSRIAPDVFPENTTPSDSTSRRSKVRSFSDYLTSTQVPF